MRPRQSRQDLETENESLELRVLQLERLVRLLADGRKEEEGSWVRESSRREEVGTSTREDGGGTMMVPGVRDTLIWVEVRLIALNLAENQC